MFGLLLALVFEPELLEFVFPELPEFELLFPVLFEPPDVSPEALLVSLALTFIVTDLLPVTGTGLASVVAKFSAVTVILALPSLLALAVIVVESY